MMTRVCAFGCALGLVLPFGSGCSTGTPGELGKGSFTTNCASGDSTCSGNWAGQPLPSHVAVGATLDVNYAGQVGTGGLAGEVVPASQLFARSTSGALEFLAPGTVALLARNSNGVVGDFVHVQVHAIHQIQIDGPTSLSVSQGGYAQEGQYEAAAYSLEDHVLGGSLPFIWSTTTPDVVTIIGSADNKARTRLRAEKAGKAELRVQVGDSSGDLQITVKETP